MISTQRASNARWCHEQVGGIRRLTMDDQLATRNAKVLSDEWFLQFLLHPKCALTRYLATRSAPDNAEPLSSAGKVMW
ncbi:hypothetical protein FSHL1_002304 [Fusarium sambucinum]